MQAGTGRRRLLPPGARGHRVGGLVRESRTAEQDAQQVALARRARDLPPAVALLGDRGRVALFDGHHHGGPERHAGVAPQHFPDPMAPKAQPLAFSVFNVPKRVLVRHPVPRVSQPIGPHMSTATSILTGADAVAEDEGYGIQPGAMVAHHPALGFRG